jgi:hypothetical protein
MVVGDGGRVNASGQLEGSMTKEENMVHFGGWCIVSSPLILAYNMSEPARRELVWDIITNKVRPPLYCLDHQSPAQHCRRRLQY